MGKRTASAETLKPDPVYNSKLVSKFINCVMTSGKKQTACRILSQRLKSVANELVVLLIRFQCKLIAPGNKAFRFAGLLALLVIKLAALCTFAWLMNLLLAFVVKVKPCPNVKIPSRWQMRIKHLHILPGKFSSRLNHRAFWISFQRAFFYLTPSILLS